MKKEHLNEVTQDLAEATAALLRIVREIPDTELDHVTAGNDPGSDPCLGCPPGPPPH